MSGVLPDDELWVLSYYRASELAGALLFGRLARRTSDGELSIFLTEHFAEEARHAWLWTSLIRELGHVPVRITETYQSHYSREIGIPATIAEVLLLTRVFEERIYCHFVRHLERPETHALVKATLKTMLEDERGHLEWVGERLARYEAEGMTFLPALGEKYREIDRRIYAEALECESRLWDFLGMKP
ncbi:MAG: ferritin-like domain-containing protein [Acidobacteriia bacterium]|nr:ferritin-like domain-containing protein [Terriglobia bacterium]